MNEALLRSVAVSPAIFSERALLENLFQFYAYDFSEFAGPDSGELQFNGDGRLDAYPFMNAYWTESDRWPLLIRVGGRLAGFALVNARSHTGEPIDRNMGEFFVARKYRRHGVAAAAVRQILTLHPGKWEIAIAARNIPAQAFWSKTISTAPNVSELASREMDDSQWRGPILTFVAASPN